MERLDVLVAKNLLKIKAVFLKPNEPFTWASGIKSPIYCDNRLTLSYVDTRKVVEEAVGNVDEMTEDEAVQKINESKKAVAKKTKKGVKVKQSLNG